ncbi:hypothetical protein WR25_09965 isoform D [Diploscapter pachys]|uniref:Arrestin C-terminal-like domain-containing protein n=1 Tax=Diploscapter pachys TaxID=2018661 RepID=A0A2A2JE32_9BILA|nr:hypothetical protein WR25_09965 isoform A [Diploscapter pachys]PAV59848.1 hypothetical protein WR25_09965 isoform B [Diploscapter pachys]PAV59849.1 hypothetical protein WR25_09965 isoform C [Diploscapter pachys]PAV59850.1 hypothetical protein WR25_09965 isoform D [Diploscapter pachys]
MCFINGSTSILAGFAIFSVLGYLSVTSGKDIAEIAKPGVGLAFLAYPEVASNLPMKQFFAFLFFLMLTILGLDSNVCTLEGLVTSIEDRFPVLRKHKRISLGVICLIFFILGLPMVTRSGVHWLTLVDAYGCSGYALLFVVFWEVVGMKRIRLAVKEMIGFTLPKIADFILMIVSPTISLILFILCLVYYKPLKYPNGADYPLWAITLGWCLSLSSILIIPGYAIYYLFAKKENQSFELMDPKKIKIEFTDIFEGVYRPGDELRGECKLSKSGYASGEDILAECSIDNGSTKPVRQAKAELIQHAKFIAYKGGRGTATFLNKKETTQNEMKEHDISVSSSVKDNMSIMPKTKHDFIIKLPVTPTIPSFDQCKIINVEYYVKIKIKTDALMNNSIVTKIPISIGTISIWPAEAPNQPGQPSAPFSENADRQYEIVPMPPPTSTIPSTFPPVHSNSTEQPQIGWSQIPMSADFPPTYDEAMRE